MTVDRVGFSGIVGVTHRRLLRSIELVVGVVVDTDKTHICGNCGASHWLEDIDSVDVHISMRRAAGQGRCGAVTGKRIVDC